MHGDCLVDDTADFDNADRGFIAALQPGVIKNAKGRVVWDSDAYSFLAGDSPDTANPSLWRQSQLCARQGLYEVAAGIYQIRGFDLSNMTLVEGETGVIVIDPLISTETAAAGLALYREHRGDRPVTGLLYSHSHGDHFGGARGVLSGKQDVPILAPADFMEHAVSENVYAGPAMNRRAAYMYGAGLPITPDGLIGMGLGNGTSAGTISLIPPTIDVTRTGQEETIDGVRIIFQLTPGTEAPSEMNFLFPDRRALCMAENATHTMHNVLTLRGAVVRDARIWSHYLNETMELFAGQYDVAFASHHWPTWGADNVEEFLGNQRDLYAYLHDQTLRLANQGFTGSEIAEQLQLPPALEKTWYSRGYYGSLSHNVKAVYQRYLGWFDGNPAHLWQHPPEPEAQRYVECLGGVDAVVAKAREYIDRDDLRFAATLLNHAVYAEPTNAAARETLAQVYQRLGYAAENGTWRNFYLKGAQELRGDVQEVPLDSSSAEVIAALSVDQLIDSLAIRLNGPRAWDEEFVIDLVVTDQQRQWRLMLHNGALTYRSTASDGTLYGPPAGLRLMLTKPQLLGLLAGGSLDGVDHVGDPGLLNRLTSLLDSADTRFPIVTPRTRSAQQSAEAQGSFGLSGGAGPTA